MKTTHQYVIDLGEEQIEKLNVLLKTVEDADSATSAVWFSEEDRESLCEIRGEIEAQTEEK